MFYIDKTRDKMLAGYIEEDPLRFLEARDSKCSMYF